MAITTPGAVQDILGPHWDGSTSVSPFIRTAAALVSWLQSQDTEGLLTDELLEEIETYLAAHFYAHSDQLFQSKSTGKASASFQGKTGMVLSSTQYGQTAMVLDVAGLLAQRSADAEKGTRRTMRAIWLGTDDETDYVT